MVSVVMIVCFNISTKGLFYLMRKTIAMTLITAFVIASHAMPALATPTRGTITADALNVRTEPSTDSASLGLLPYGASVELCEQVGSWYKIDFMDQVGYIFGSYVNVDGQIVEADKLDAHNTREKLIEIAKQYIGTPYVYGGSTPAGFDCSGFVKYVYEKIGISLPRTSYSQANVGTKVGLDELEIGDIVCFGYSSINHVGIYVGDGNYIHSPRSGYTLCISSMAERVRNGNFRYGRRIID